MFRRERDGAWGPVVARVEASWRRWCGGGGLPLR
jgi:hypothetical protein